MSEIKVRLSLDVPGAQRISREEALKYPSDSYDVSHIKVEYTDKGKKKYETVLVKTLKNRVVKQSIQISREAYDYMVEEPVSDKFRKKVLYKKQEARLWDTLSLEKKLSYHFNKIAEHFGASGFSFEILDD